MVIGGVSAGAIYTPPSGLQRGRGEGASPQETSAPGAGPNELTREQKEQVRELQRRDQEVRTHEQAHANAGGPYAGSPQYEYQEGPDGRDYAVGGEVPIDVSPVPNDPEATIAKMEIVKRAALAPAEPSPQDRRVASQADQVKAQAQQEKVQKDREEREEEEEGGEGAGRAPGIGANPSTSGRDGQPPGAVESFAPDDGDEDGAAVDAPSFTAPIADRAIASYQASAGILAARAPALFAVTV